MIMFSPVLISPGAYCAALQSSGADGSVPRNLQFESISASNNNEEDRRSRTEQVPAGRTNAVRVQMIFTQVFPLPGYS
jgi:hypothetical protein